MSTLKSFDSCRPGCGSGGGGNGGGKIGAGYMQHKLPQGTGAPIAGSTDLSVLNITFLSFSQINAPNIAHLSSPQGMEWHLRGEGRKRREMEILSLPVRC